MTMYENLNDSEKEELLKLNNKFESDAVHEGVQRYHRTMQAIDPASKRPEKVVIGTFLDEVAKHIANEQKNLALGNATSGSPSYWYAPFIAIRAEKLAMIGLSYMMESPKQVSSVLCRQIGDAIRAQVMLEEIREINKQKNPNQKGFTRDDSKRFLKNLPKIQKVFNNLNHGKAIKWKLSAKIALGSKIVQSIIQATGGWTVQVEFVKRNVSKAFVVMNDELVEYLNQYHVNLEALRPVKFPLCVPPLPWGFADEHGIKVEKPTDTITGGYRILKEEFITGHRGHHAADLKTDTMNLVFEAVNHIQSTQWRIDKDIYSLATHIVSLNSPEYNNIIPCVPQKPKLPPIPQDKAGRRLWHQNRIQQRARWHSETSRRIAAIKAMDVAKQFIDLPVFFAYELDFRGRIYAKASHISPQGSDLSRALLRYEEKLPLGPDGLDRLIIYAASLAGHDKITYADRIKWFNETWMPVLKGKSKLDPMEHKVWVDYDYPLQFIQITWEIQAAVNSPDHTKFKSSVNVSADASNNGLQHLSALMRDEVGGKSVNLIDSELPEDMYMNVADKVKDIIFNDYNADPTAKDKLGNDAPHVIWYKEFTKGTPEQQKRYRRKVCKRPTLSSPYGVTQRGVEESLIADGFTDGLKGSQYHNANYLARAIFEAIDSTVIQASVLMKYLRDIAKILGEAGHPIFWKTPLGLPIVQEYVREESRIIKTCLHHCTFYVPNGNKQLDVSAQVRGIVANFIHSLDATNAGYSALDMKDEGINSVSFIHDSIGCHACHMTKLHEIVRKTFINLHHIRLLENFVSDLEKKTNIKLPPIPQKGKLKLNSIRSSRWFFS